MVKTEPERRNVATFHREHRNLFDKFTRNGESFVAHLTKAEQLSQEGRSKQGANTGEKPHPFDMEATVNFKNHNVHHSTCIETKTSSTAGLGFEQDEIAQTLDELCEISFQDVMNDVVEDFWQTGNGWMEVVRMGDEIVGLHHVPTSQVRVVVEDRKHNKHYIVRSTEASFHGGSETRFAKFGEKEDFIARAQEFSDIARPTLPSDQDDISELIHFRRSTSLSRWYGFPDWLAGVASVELEQCLTQHTFDFFLNRGVPEFLLFVTGKEVDKPDWEAIEKGIQANIGLGNSHKSMAINLPAEDIKIQLEKLAMEGSDSSFFATISDVLGLKIVSAHRVPPLLAGIQIPGKLGATNELPNALMAFQVLVIGPAQQLITSILRCTLGADEGVPSLKGNEFALNKITEEIDVGVMDTVGSMRQTVPEARAEGRDLEEGLQD